VSASINAFALNPLYLLLCFHLPRRLSSFSSVEYARGHRLLALGQMFLERWDAFQDLIVGSERGLAVGSKRGLEHGFWFLTP
jgi:hypothetical protein